MYTLREVKVMRDMIPRKIMVSTYGHNEKVYQCRTCPDPARAFCINGELGCEYYNEIYENVDGDLEVLCDYPVKE